ncbi:hypothetical protein Leryth_005549 [Lithospermum erythrorhizon]|nr:hypothetical protein Leryth_005549 [Lithospermum erythrorhizon]
MGGETWSLSAKLCDSCKTTSSSVFCRADSAFLCLGCDSKIHAANKLASRHARVWMCEVCEQAAATVTCKADAAALCRTCDRDIHSANPLARRHERVPVVPFFDSATATTKTHGGGSGGECGGDESTKFINDIDINENDVTGEEEEAEAASWLLLPNTNPAPKGLDLEGPAEYLFNDMDPYMDMDLLSGERKPHVVHQQHYHNSDGVVPVNKNEERQNPTHFIGPVVDGYPTYEVDCSGGSKPFLYNFTSQSISQSMSSSSLDVGVVPDHNPMADVSTGYPPRSEAVLPSPITGVDREARVLRYREKRKNRKFEKTIRYASRKAYAETRPRIKGRFAKRTDQVEDVESLINLADTSSYSVVPSY